MPVIGFMLHVQYVYVPGAEKKLILSPSQHWQADVASRICAVSNAFEATH